MGPSNEQYEYLQLLKEWNKPEWHRPVDLGISGFKRFVRSLPITKKTQAYMIKRYKTRAWMEFEAAPGPKGTFPTHPQYGTKIKVKTELDVEYEIEVKKNGQHKK